MTLIKRKKDNYLPVYSLKDQVDSLFNSFFDDFPLRASNSVFDNIYVPRVNVSETKTEYHVDAELPGIGKEDVQVKYSDNLLTISAQRKEEKEDKDKNYHRVESFYGTFQRSVKIPSNVQKDNIEAEFKDGVLKIKLPKSEDSASDENLITIK